MKLDKNFFNENIKTLFYALLIAVIIRSLLNLIIIHHVLVVTATFVLFFRKEDKDISEEINTI